ncbi:hypothetical protein BGZ73_004582 [Actinomortierella ambigua]|nr:hypothetical protein BGZ73_004582 [Actinomortierella ambigua]
MATTLRLSVTKTWSTHKDTPRIICPLCNSVRRCGYAGIQGFLSLGISQMSQRDINLKTLQLFDKTGKVPLFSEVDSAAVIIAPRTTSYANVLLQLSDDFDYTTPCTCHPQPHTFEMHKGFFTTSSVEMLQQITTFKF